MKKILFLIILLLPTGFSREEIPILPLDRGVYINYTDESLDLIDVDKMRRAKSVQKAKNEIREKPINPIQIDTRYLKHQKSIGLCDKPE